MAYAAALAAALRAYSLTNLVAVMRENRRMAAIEVSEDWVRRVVGGDVFGRAAEQADKVSRLRADGLVGSGAVDGVPVSVRILPDGIAGECGCPADGLCVHAVAALLAVIAAGESSPTMIGGLVGRPATSLAHRLDMLAAAGFMECRQDLVLPAARTCPVS